MVPKKVYYRKVDQEDPHSEYVDMVELKEYMLAKAEVAGLERMVQAALQGLLEYKETGQGLVKTENMLREILNLEEDEQKTNQSEDSPDATGPATE